MNVFILNFLLITYKHAYYTENRLSEHWVLRNSRPFTKEAATGIKSDLKRPGQHGSMVKC